MPLIIVNGEKVPHDSMCISAFDRGITLGHGLFETILINEGCTPLINYHWDRLVASAKLININIPFTLIELEHMIQELIELNELRGSNGGVRLTVTDGIAPRGVLSNGHQPSTFIINTFSMTTHSIEPMSASVVLTRKNENSVSSQIKSTSYLDLILAKREAVSKGFEEAFLLNSKGNLAEGAITNIFVIKGNKIYTPSIAEGALPGITRHIILNELHFDGLSIQEESITLDFLKQADEIFISNALLGIRAIKVLDDLALTTPYQITDLVSARYQEFIASKSQEYVERRSLTY